MKNKLIKKTLATGLTGALACSLFLGKAPSARAQGYIIDLNTTLGTGKISFNADSLTPVAGGFSDPLATFDFGGKTYTGLIFGLGNNVPVFGSTDSLVLHNSAGEFVINAFGSDTLISGTQKSDLFYMMNNFDKITTFQNFSLGSAEQTQLAAITGFSLTPVPEPGTLALLGLGGAGLIAGNRRKIFGGEKKSLEKNKAQKLEVA